MHGCLITADTLASLMLVMVTLDHHADRQKLVIFFHVDVDDGVDSGDGGIDDGGDGDGYDGGAPGLRAWASRETAGARVDDGEIRSQRWPAQDQACCMQ